MFPLIIYAICTLIIPFYAGEIIRHFDKFPGYIQTMVIENIIETLQQGRVCKYFYKVYEPLYQTRIHVKLIFEDLLLKFIFAGATTRLMMFFPESIRVLIA